MKNMKKLFALVLALALCFSLAIPAMADDTTTGGGGAIAAPVFDITIKVAYTQEKHSYEAYQVFSGEITKNAQGNDILSTIEWGSGVNGAGIIAALKAEGFDYKTQFAGIDNAEDVADVLSNNSSNTNLVHAFRHIVEENLAGVPAVPGVNDPVNGYYTIPDVEPGYYFIRDAENSLSGVDSYTNYILQVVGDTDITPKGGTVTDDKKINDGGTLTNVGDYNIGDSVSFILEGTLPGNYDVFSDFQYRFVDTLSAGLTFNDDVKVYMVNPDAKTQLTEGTDYVVNDETPSVEGATFTVDFADLKKIAAIDSHTKLVVEYSATVNEDAVVGGSGNMNSSYVKFSNDPHSGSEGETPKNYVFAFTWELDNTKIDGKTGVKLDTAKFVLYRVATGDINEYVILSNGKVSGWTTVKDKATVMESKDDGVFNVIGLEANTYYLEEIEAPDGYHKLDDPVKVNIVANVSVNEAGDEAVVNNLQIQVGNTPLQNGNTTTGVVTAQIVNNPGATLPETGGVGTTMFYIAGGIMVAAAAVLLIAKKRKVEE